MLYDIVNTYKPSIIWSDGDWEMSDDYWKSKEFLAWLFNDSPVKDTVVVNDRWGSGINCHHGSYYTCTDRYNPGVLNPHKWENCFTIDSSSWGYNKLSHIEDYLTIEQLISELVSTVACNGNFLLNVGPTADGLILPVFEERLLQIGEWMKVNSEAIYGTRPWKYQNETASNVWYTSKQNVVYAIVLGWPKGNVLKLSLPIATSSTTAELLGYGKVDILPKSSGLGIIFPALTPDLLPCKWAWTVKFTQLAQ
eukprot:TRINITY_DN372_c0_g1_i1.p1 TRINITY_DN372_c0_g1~~TRINITY_DN372_c0_g1_i1.p1  ORF type:complete len:252 (-),score=53.16 TRINITY_DN372_c0_g1_i1:27-782(-)